jgi:hypothetical protein
VKIRHTKMMGAQKARTLVKNHCRTPTISRFFFVRIQVCLRIAIRVGASARGEGAGRVVLLSCLMSNTGRSKGRAGSRVKQQRQGQKSFLRGRIWETEGKKTEAPVCHHHLTNAHTVYTHCQAGKTILSSSAEAKRGRRVGKSERPLPAARRPLLPPMPR